MKFTVDNSDKKLCRKLTYKFMSKNEDKYYMIGCGVLVVYFYFSDQMEDIKTIADSQFGFLNILWATVYYFVLGFLVSWLLFVLIRYILVFISSKYSDKKFKNRYAVCNASFDKEKYSESSEDYSFTINLKEIKKIRTCGDCFFVICHREKGKQNINVGMFHKSQFTDEKTYLKVLEKFQNSLNDKR